MTDTQSTVKPKCLAKKSSGGLCQMQAGYGTDHLGWGRCKHHGGCTQAGKTAAARQEAEVTIRTLGINMGGSYDPQEVLLAEVDRAARAVAWLDNLIGDLDTQDIIGLTEMGFKQRAWMDVWTQQRTLLAKAAKMAIDAGISERQVKLAEQQGAMIAQIIRGVLNDLDLTAEQRAAAPALVRKHIGIIEANARELTA